MNVVTPTTIDIEIIQFLIQTGYSRDIAVRCVTTWFDILLHHKLVSAATVTAVINNSEQFNVTYKLPNNKTVFTKVYTVSNLPGSKGPTTPPPKLPKKSPVAPKKVVEKKKSDEDILLEAWDRAMRGI